MAALAGVVFDGVRKISCRLDNYDGLRVTSGSYKNNPSQKIWQNVQRLSGPRSLRVCVSKSLLEKASETSTRDSPCNSSFKEEKVDKRQQPSQQLPFWPLSRLQEVVLPTMVAAVVVTATLVPLANAADPLETCKCLLKECRVEFARCLGDVKCAANIACLQACNGRPDETECQIGCGDVFENSVVDQFNTCAVSEKKCVPQKQDENLYPVPPNTALVPEFRQQQFDGVWYITSGLNPTFDTFDCQVHEFKTEGDTMTAKLNWRIKTPTGGFIERKAVQTFVQDPGQPGILYNHDNEFLHYEDDWYILAAKDEQKEDDYILVYYRGKNDAWIGYGGAVVYTRSKTLPESIVPQLREATSKVGIDFDRQFRTTNNQCLPQEPLLLRLEEKVEEGEKTLLASIQDFGRKLVLVGRTQLDLFSKLKDGLMEVERDEARFLQELTADEKEFFETLKMDAAEIETLFGDALPVRRFR